MVIFQPAMLLCDRLPEGSSFREVPFDLYLMNDPNLCPFSHDFEAGHG